IDTQGGPLAGVAVAAIEIEGGELGVSRRMSGGGRPGAEDDVVRTASDGTFTMHLEAGTYDFAFRREGLAAKTVGGQTISATSAPAIEATMEPSVEVSGRVTRAGSGVENVRVDALMPDFDTSDTRTVPDGSFTVSGLPAGPIRLMALNADEFIQETRTVTAPARNV